MTDSSAQQQQQHSSTSETHNSTTITQHQRQLHLQKLSARWPLDLSRRVEEAAFNTSAGNQSVYLHLLEAYNQQLQNSYRNRAIQQQQQMIQAGNNTGGTYSNSQINVSQSTSTSQPSQGQIPASLSAMLNQPIRLPNNQQQQPRMINTSQNQLSTQPNFLNAQTTLGNGTVRLREPSPFQKSSMANATSNTISSTPKLPSTLPTTPTVDLSKTYPTQSQANKTNSNHGVSPTSSLQPSYSSQLLAHSRTQSTANLNASFPCSTISTSNNADILQQYIIGNPSNASTRPSSPALKPSATTVGVTPVNGSVTGDRLLQQILSSSNDGTMSKIPIVNRSLPAQQTLPSTTSQPIRPSVGATNNRNSSGVHPSITNQQSSAQLSSATIFLPMKSPLPSIQLPTSNSMTIQQTPLNVTSQNSSSFSMNPQQPASVTNNHSMSNNRSFAPTESEIILDPDEEILKLIKYLKENVGSLQTFTKKYMNEGNITKAREIQNFHQLMLQFIVKPTHDVLPRAKQIRQVLERALSRSHVSLPSSKNDFSQYEKGFQEFLSHDQRKRSTLTKLFIEPLSDVLNGVPHKKIRLDVDNDFHHFVHRDRPSLNRSFQSRLNEELNCLPSEIFSIDQISIGHFPPDLTFDDEQSNNTTIILRCILLEVSNPLVPPLRLRISADYPEGQPEILSITNSTPPKLDFADAHPFFEQISKHFLYHLFQSSRQHSITDILNIWRQSVQTAR